jgi:hypothetical protein
MRKIGAKRRPFFKLELKIESRGQGWGRAPYLLRPNGSTIKGDKEVIRYSSNSLKHKSNGEDTYMSLRGERIA